MNLTIPQFTPATASPRSTLSIPTMSKPALKVPQLQRSGNVQQIIAEFPETHKTIAALIKSERMLSTKGPFWREESSGMALKKIKEKLSKYPEEIVQYVRLVLSQAEADYLILAGE
jgi:hypothetical protein